MTASLPRPKARNPNNPGRGTGAGAGDRGAPFLSGARYAGARPVLSTSLGSMEVVVAGWKISWRTLALKSLSCIKFWDSRLTI